MAALNTSPTKRKRKTCNQGLGQDDWPAAGRGEAALELSSFQNALPKLLAPRGTTFRVCDNGEKESVMGAGLVASFKGPYDAAYSPDGTLAYITDCKAHKILKLRLSGMLVTTLAGSGEEGSADGT